uniref:Protein kinase domain-containing protein n=1 Tax=Macrostomum lignano TaxID=282301 RepID=A0A1I8I5G6_9PLAT
FERVPNSPAGGSAACSCRHCRLLLIIVSLLGLLGVLIFHQLAGDDASAAASMLAESSSPGESAEPSLSKLYSAALTEIVFDTHRRRQLEQQLLESNCRRRYRSLRPLGAGWSKAAELAVDAQTGETVALKRPHRSGRDMLDCLRRRLGDVDGCYERLAGKFLRELVFLQSLDGTDGIVRLKGWCLSHREFYIATEVGNPLDIVSLLQMGWEDRLRIAADLAQLLHRLHASPVGSLALRDFRRGQFALAGDGRLKLIDLDDLDRRLPRCSGRDGLCSEKVDKVNYVSTRCRQWTCPGHNDRVNLHRAGGQFFNFLLLHGAPPGLANGVRKLRRPGSANSGGGSQQLLIQINRLVQQYSNGKYSLVDQAAGHSAAAFQLVPNATVSGSDYPCSYTVLGARCRVTAFSLAEARLLCAGEPGCRGFVVTPDRSWTNRTVIILKSAADKPVRLPGYQLYLRK